MNGDATRTANSEAHGNSVRGADDGSPAFRLTSLGLLPLSWAVHVIGDHFEVASAKRVFKRDWRSDGVPFYRAREVSELAAYGRVQAELFISKALYYEYKTRFGVPTVGDALVTGVGTLGRLSVVRTHDEFYFKDASVLWLKSLCTYSTDLLKHYFDTRLIIDQIADSTSGTTVGTFTIGNARNTKIPVPPDNEQVAIAEALSDVNELLGALDALIGKKQAIKQAAMQQLLTGRNRLPGFTSPWKTERLGAIAEIEMGQSPSSKFYNSEGVGLPLIQGNADIRYRRTVKRTFTTHITKRGHPGDIVVSVRAPVGEVARAEFDVCLGRGVCAVRFPNDFLYHYLIHLEPSWARRSSGSTFDSVNSADVRAVEIHLPTDATEQSAIATVLADMDVEIGALEARRGKTSAIKLGMMQQLLTGRIRLVKPTPPMEASA